MAELNITPHLDIDHKASTTPMQDINRVYETCKFGWFHIKMLFVAFVGCMTAILVTGSLSYLLPAAECDLKMNLRQKGLLNAMPYIGTLISSVIAGFLIDTFGRIIFLKIGFGGTFIFNIVAASSQNYEMLATAKLFEGVLFATSLSALMSITSEFCHTSIRDRVMLCQLSFGAIAQIINPAMAWGLLTQNWQLRLFDGKFVLNTWNFYLYAMSLWALSAILLYCTLPESPKYLITQNKYAEAKEILIKIYTTNTGKAADTFPMQDLWIKEMKEIQLMDSEDQMKRTMRDQLANGFQNVKPMFRRPMITYLILISIMQLVIFGMYNVIRLWFPQLSAIVEHYKFDANSDFCALLDDYTDSLTMRSNSSAVCVPTTSGAQTYINSIIIGFVCILPYFISGMLVNKVGKKALLISASLICVAASLGLRWANSSAMMVSLFSLDIALAQTLKSLVQVVLVEIFPTSMRSLAMSIAMSSARVGTLMGNIAFPILLDVGCAIPFFTMAGMMMCVSVLSLFIPKKKQ